MKTKTLTKHTPIRLANESIKCFKSLSCCLVFILLLSCAGSPGHSIRSVDQKDERPNIILIMSDDMGYSDLGTYGGEIHTPNLDKLADEGLKFTQFYNAARCCPTRASLLTGLYPHQTGIGHMTNTPKDHEHHDLGIPQYRGFLNETSVTLAEVLRDAGYVTLMTGKWHLGIRDRSKWPLQRGFDKFYGIIPGASNYFRPKPPRGITYMNEPVEMIDGNYYTTDAFTDYAIRFIDEAQEERKEDPFFLYLAYTAPHWPIQAPKEEVEKYLGRYDDGWSALRKERYQNMLMMGLLNDEWELTPRDSRDWDELSDEKKEEMALRRAIYSAMVDKMDQNIGRLMNYLEEQDLRENTLIIFLNDNGACAEFAELGSGPKEQLNTKKGYVLSYGKAWANASNTPFREYKHWVHEGGISTPFIVNWPAGIREDDQGKIINNYAFLPDIMATFAELSQSDYPAEYNGNKITPLQGKSLLPIIKNGDMAIHDEPIFWEHEGNKAVRHGNFKLVSKWSREESADWELYNMKTDRTEMHDLSEKMPEKVSEMKKMFETWGRENEILPYRTIDSLTKAKRNR